MSKTLFLEPSWYGTGLTNEIFFIVYGIIDCINNKRKNLVINNFRVEPMTNKFCGINKIIDIHHLNILLKKYDIAVFDRNNLSFNIDSIIYGLNENTFDITKEAKELFYTSNNLLIPSGTILNNIKGDPLSGQQKKLYITYTINSNTVVEEYSEYIHKDIILDLQNPTNILNWEQIYNCYVNERELFDYLLKNINFNNRFVKYTEIALLIDRNNEYTNISNIDFQNKKTNVIHLRVEKDMTGHMLSHNKMTQEKYDIDLQNKYIELIKKYFSKNDIIFVLSYDLNNNVIKFLKENDYEFYFTKKQIFEGREQHAIVDLLIGEKCNNYFIGNWNFAIRQGSTFSYFLYVRNNADKNIFIDMYNINNTEIEKNNYIIGEVNYDKTLKELVNNLRTDKNTRHSYLDLYQKLLCSKKNTAKNILEIGIGYHFQPNGGSIKLWHDYFLNANIYTLDIQHIDGIWDEIKNKDRINLFTSIDAYDEINFKELFLDKNIKFDMMLDDGPHTLESMKQFIKLYTQIMTEDGILMIEDVQSIDWIDELKKVVPNELVRYIEVYDLRHIKNRFDDIVFVINKNKELIIDSKIDGENSVKYILENNIEGVLYNKMTKICFITAIYGGYETSCKKFVKQTIDTDFICFTDNNNIINNGWIIDTTPYHLINKSEIDNDSFTNSLCNNTHTFNIAKYYKQAFSNIPILQKYDVIVWLDGTIEIIYDKTSEYILNNIYKKKIIGWHHEYRNGVLSKEVKASHYARYTSTYWNGQSQPYQDVDNQYKFYLEDGYNELFFKNLNSHTPHMGVWITCFVAFLHKDSDVKKFLDTWYLQTLKYTTQDQIGFSYVCQKINMIPFTLPNNEIYGDCPHFNTKFYLKKNHGE